MKKILLILLCVPLIGVGQTAEEYFNKAESYRLNKEYQLAIDNYTNCLELDSEYGENNGAITYNNRGVGYFHLENYKSAIEDYRRAIKIESDIPTFFDNIKQANIMWEATCEKPKKPRKLSSNQTQEDFEESEKYKIYLSKFNKWKECRTTINNTNLYSKEMQIDKETGLVEIDNVMQIEGLSKDELYLNSKLWINSFFKFGLDVIQLDDKDNGIIITKGIFPFSTSKNILGMKVYDNCYFTLKIYCKDGRVRVIWTNMEFDYGGFGIKVPSDLSFLSPYKDDGMTPHSYRSLNKAVCLLLIDSYNHNLKKALAAKLDDW